MFCQRANRLCICLLIGACATAETGAPPEATVRDSAGITIVTNDLRERTGPDVWTVSLDPVVSIGSFEGAPEQQLFQVTGAVRLSDGRIVVANAGSRELRFYVEDGAYLHASGGEGGGPGEFSRITWLQRFGADSLAAYDDRARRISIFDAAGRFMRAVELSHVEGLVTPIGVFADGTGLIRFRSRPGAEGRQGVQRDTVPYMTLAPGSVIRDTVGTFPTAEAFVQTDGNRVGLMPLTFGIEPQSVVLGDRFVYAPAEELEVGMLHRGRPAHAADTWDHRPPPRHARGGRSPPGRHGRGHHLPGDRGVRR